MSGFSIPNQALRGHDPNCGICGQRKTAREYTTPKGYEAVRVTVYLCNQCDFNQPAEVRDGK